MTIEPEQLTIWTFLDRVVADPVAANTIDLSNWIGSLRLEPAGDALVTWAGCYRDRAIKLLDEWQHQPSLFAGELVEPQYDRAIFDELVLGRIEWDLGDLVETSDNYYPPGRQAVSTVAPVSKSTALELAELQAAMDVAHSEDIDRWSRRIRDTIAEYDGEISLSKLRERADLSLVDVWLGLLLGDTECRVWRQSDEQLDIAVDFYSLDGLLVTEELQKCFIGWMQAVQKITEGELINIDGKTLRGAREAGNSRSLIHMVSVWSASQHLVLGQQKVSEKSNEITAIPALLKLLTIRGCLVSIADAIAPRFPRRALHQADAMGCQTEIAKTIVEEGGDYVLALKGNQGDLHTNVVQL